MMQATVNYRNTSSPNTSLEQSSRHTYTHLTYSRHHLVRTAKGTIKIAENGEYTNRQGHKVNLKEDLDWAVEHCTHYQHEYDFEMALQQFDEERELESNIPVVSPPSRLMNPTTQHNRFARTDFLVVSASWLEAASQLLEASEKLPFPSEGNPSNMNNYIRVGILNSASGTTPGGRFFKGTLSQEDCLCRASLLYSCISQPKFQSADRFYGKNRSFKYGSSNCVIFSPGAYKWCRRMRVTSHSY